MPDGSDLQTDVADLVNAYDTTVSAENTRLLRMASVAQRDIVSEILTVDEDWLLRSQTFPTVASRYPNRYSLPSDFVNFRYLERVLDATTGSVERIHPIQHIPDKELTDDRFYTDSSAVVSSGVPDGYLLGSDFIEIHPISDSVYTLRIWYEKSVADLAAGTDIDLPYPLYHALVYAATVAMLRSTNQPYGDEEGKYNRALARGISAIHQRSDDGPRTVHYTQHRGEYV